jgi:hypothetical protein
MRTRALLLTAVVVTAAPVSGQSLFNSAGMGLPVEALDGRARALGNLGIGLRGGSLMPTDPAAVAGYRLATGVMASQARPTDWCSRAGRIRRIRYSTRTGAWPMRL